MTGPSSWNVLLVDLRSSSCGWDTIWDTIWDRDTSAKHSCVGRCIIDRARIFEFVLHLVKCDTLAVPSTQIIIIIRYKRDEVA